MAPVPFLFFFLLFLLAETERPKPCVGRSPRTMMLIGVYPGMRAVSRICLQQTSAGAYLASADRGGIQTPKAIQL